MADKKKHHYVPKFHLRNFATRLDIPPKQRKQIHQLDVNKLAWRFNIGLKDQCHSPYLYGKTPELENLLENFEGEFASIFRSIISGNFNNLSDSHTELYIRFFAILSIIRTPRQKQYIDDSVSNIVDKLVELNFPEYKGQIRATYEGFYHQAIGKLSSFAVSLDGTRAIAVKSSGASFITSDNPVVRHNQIFRMHNKTHPCLGFLSRGLQIFIPISPKIMLIIFDEEAYKLKGVKKGNILCSDNDVRLLNSLQVLNCDNSIYFSSKEDTKYIDLKYTRRPKRNLGESEFIHLKHAIDPLRELVIQQEIRHLPNIPLSFMKSRISDNVNPSSIISPMRRDPDYIRALSKMVESEISKNRSDS